MGLGITRCLHCGAPLPSAERTTRPRLYCSDRCRSRLRRWCENLPAVEHEAEFLEDVFHVPCDPDEAVLYELLALQNSVIVLRSVVRRARPVVATPWPTSPPCSRAP